MIGCSRVGSGGGEIYIIKINKKTAPPQKKKIQQVQSKYICSCTVF